MTFIDELRSRLKAKQKQWERAKEEVRRAKERESKLRDELSAIQVLLNAEKPTRLADKASAALLPIPPQPEASVAEIVRSLIREHSSTGLTPAQLRALLHEKKIATSTNYLYSILLRAKKAERITERNGRYFPVDQKNEAAS